IHELTADHWQLLAPPLPTGGSPGHLTFDPDGALWGDAGALASARTFSDGRWSERIPMPQGYVTAFTFDGAGDPWAVGLHGYVARWDDDHFSLVEGLPLPEYSDATVDGIVFDRDNVAWLWSNQGWILRLEGDDARWFASDDERNIGVRLDRDRRPLLLGSQLRRLDEEGWPVLVDFPVAGAIETAEGWWFISDGHLLWMSGGETTEVAVPAPSPLVSVARLANDGLAVRDEKLRFYLSRPGDAPPLRDVATDWGLAAVGDRPGAWAGDLDADGSDDLLVRADGGDVRLLIQHANTFVDETDLWNLSLRPHQEHMALCDLDGNGRTDLLTREIAENDDAQGEQKVILRYLRTMDGWFEDATGTLPGPVPPAVAEGQGRFTCADVDGDGDLDLLVCGGMANLPDGPRVALYENLGFGRLAPVPLPSRGLGYGRGWIQQALVDDVDGDSLTDFVLLGQWDEGHQVFRGQPGFRLQDLTRGSGLNSTYTTPDRGWLTRIDGDDLADLLVIDYHSIPRVWRGDADLRFEDVTVEWGLEQFADWTGTGRARSVFADLDGNGTLDLVAGAQLQGLRLALGQPGGGFVERSAAIPRREGDRQALLTLDLGGDGDLDLLSVHKGPDVLLENLSDRPGRFAGPAADTGPSWRRTVARRLVWARPVFDGGLFALFALAWLGAGFAARLAGSRRMLGTLAAPPLLLSGTGLAYLALLESPSWARITLALCGAALAVGTAWSEIALDRYRKARRVAGYRIVRRIGAGGMGTVYLARDVSSGASVALKLVNPELLATEADRALFQREADLSASIEDPRIVRVLGFGEWTLVDEGIRRPTAYLVMELLTGSTLRAFLEQRGRLDLADACAIAREVALALDTIHDLDIVHRDIKPENVMLVGGGRVKVMDFGAARQVGHMTRSTRQVLGTMGYLAPEQGRGQSPDPRSDVYAVGVVLYELLAGHRPFDSEDLVQLLSMVLYREPPPLSETRNDVPDELWEVISRALAKAPDDRQPSAAALAAALEPWAGTLELSDDEIRIAGSKGVAPSWGAALDPSTPSVLLRVLSLWFRWARTDGPKDLGDFAVSLVEDAARREGNSETVSRGLQQLGAELRRPSQQQPTQAADAEGFRPSDDGEQP
ncbi:MAG: protein kinase, partial [Myxococcota bacterium]|nr:protein kinase [Myxococcota bacterium]